MTASEQRVALLIELLQEGPMTKDAILAATGWTDRVLTNVRFDHRKTATAATGFVIHDPSEGGRFHLAMEDSDIAKWRATEVTFIWRQLRVLEHSYELFGGSCPARVRRARRAMESLREDAQADARKNARENTRNS